MKAASGFGLTELVDRCEKYLIGSVKLEDCVRLYTIAEELGTKKLRDHCSSLISCHWVSDLLLKFFHNKTLITICTNLLNIRMTLVGKILRKCLDHCFTSY